MTGIEAIRALSMVRQSATFAAKLVDSMLTPLAAGSPPGKAYIEATLGKILTELQCATEGIEALSRDE